MAVANAGAQRRLHAVVVRPCWTSAATENATRRAATRNRDADVGIEFAANGHLVLPSCRASCVNTRDDLAPFVAGGEDTMVGAVGVDDACHDFCVHDAGSSP